MSACKDICSILCLGLVIVLLLIIIGHIDNNIGLGFIIFMTSTLSYVICKKNNLKEQISSLDKTLTM